MDGQQRLTSLYIGIYGSLETIPKWKRRNVSENWKTRRLYIKPYLEEREDDDTPYRFVFLDEGEVNRLNSGKEPYDQYYLVSSFFDCDSKELRDRLKVGQIRTKEEDWKYVLEKLRYCINEKKILPIHTIWDKKITDVLEIFKRINSGGTQLSPSNLLFSTVITSWEKGREEMDNFIKSINKEECIVLREDFLIRVCLYLVNNPASAKIEALRKDVVEKIKEHWTEIKDAIVWVKNFLIEHNITDEALVSYNALMPIIYYAYYSKRKDQKEIKEQLFNYLAIAQLFSVFGGSSADTLEKVRRALCKNAELGTVIEPFSIKNLFEVDLSTSRRRVFDISKDDIEHIVDTVGYGDKKSYTLLSLIQPNIVLNKSKGNYYDVDHVCSKDEVSELFKGKWANGPEGAERAEAWRKANLISNLQLLDASLNRGEKNKDRLYDWAITKHKRGTIPCDPFEEAEDVEVYRIDSKEKFYAYYEGRREKIIAYLCARFGIVQ